MMKAIYLGKGGRIHGPFTSAEFDQLTASGRIDQYSWIWDHAARGWKPLEPPPPPLHTLESASGSSTGSVRRSGGMGGLEALCMTRATVLGGELGGVTETGCEMIAPLAGATPAVPVGSRVVLNLLEPSSGRAVNVRAEVVSVKKRRDGWVYRFRWDGCPEMIHSSAGAYAPS